MNIQDICKKWEGFWLERNHIFLPPVSLVAAKDSTAMFNVAGMQQLIPFLSGKPHTLGKRLFNIQGCVRTNDIEDIGDERHLSYFHMMGNWSLGDYFKKEAITYSIEFLTKELNIPLEALGATIFAGSEKHGIERDSVAEQVLEELGVKHIVALGFDENDESDNFWIAGADGPCGPCCEFYVDRGAARGADDWNLGTNDRYIEVWNNVFMEFYKNKDGSLDKLPQQNVDTGMGLERLAMILQQKETIFETDMFAPVIKLIEEFYTKQFGEPREYPPYYKIAENSTDIDKIITRSYRIIVDHSRSATVLLRDGISPSNEGKGYVLRRLIRRMYYHMQKIGNDSLAWKHTSETLYNFFRPIVVYSLDSVHFASTQIIDKERYNTITQAIVKECLQFQDTIKKGQKIIEHGLVMPDLMDSKLSGEFVFQAYDTYGIPVELMVELAEERNLEVDMQGFADAMEKARSLSRSATKKKFSRGTDWATYISGIAPTQYIGYGMEVDEANSKNTTVILKDFTVDGQRILIFDKTPFYAEGGGEVADHGEIILDGGEIVKIVDVQKIGGVYLHFVA